MDSDNYWKCPWNNLQLSFVLKDKTAFEAQTLPVFWMVAHHCLVMQTGTEKFSTGEITST